MLIKRQCPFISFSPSGCSYFPLNLFYKHYLYCNVSWWEQISLYYTSFTQTCLLLEILSRLSNMAHGLCLMSREFMYKLLCFAMVFEDPTYAGKVKHWNSKTNFHGSAAEICSVFVCCRNNHENEAKCQKQLDSQALYIGETRGDPS